MLPLRESLDDCQFGRASFDNRRRKRAAETTVRGRVGDKDVAFTAETRPPTCRRRSRCVHRQYRSSRHRNRQQAAARGRRLFPPDRRRRRADVRRWNVLARSSARGPATEKATLTCHRPPVAPIVPRWVSLGDARCNNCAVGRSRQRLRRACAQWRIGRIDGSHQSRSWVPSAAIRVALKDGEWIAIPTLDDLEQSVFELVVAWQANASGEHRYHHGRGGLRPLKECG